MDKATLIASYLEQTATQAKVEKALEVTKSRRSALVKQVFDTHGKGPHDVGGKEMIVIAKGETYFFMPAKKKGSEAQPGASEG